MDQRFISLCSANRTCKVAPLMLAGLKYNHAPSEDGDPSLARCTINLQSAAGDEHRLSERSNFPKLPSRFDKWGSQVANRRED